VEEAVVFNAIMGIKSGAVGPDGFSIKFIRSVLPNILSVLNHLFNFVITPSLNLELRLFWRIFVLLAFFQD
jgi:hypothetical protein